MDEKFIPQIESADEVVDNMVRPPMIKALSIMINEALNFLNQIDGKRKPISTLYYSRLLGYKRGHIKKY